MAHAAVTSTPIRKSQVLYDFRQTSETPAENSFNDSFNLDDSFVVAGSDDCADKRKLQRVRQRRSSVCNAIGKERVDEPAKSAIAGLSETEKEAHYDLCMKLSQENKVTAKNVFNLHLAAYLNDLVKRTGYVPNFQMASLALQASARIYAIKVDCLHHDAVKIACGLTVKKGKKETNENEDGVNETEEEEKPNRRRTKRKRPKSFIAETRVLNSAKQEAFPQPHSRFKCLSKTSKDGRPSSMLGQLPIKDDNCKILLTESCAFIQQKGPFTVSKGCVPDTLRNMLNAVLKDADIIVSPTINLLSFFEIKYPLDDDELLPNLQSSYARELAENFDKIYFDRTLVEPRTEWETLLSSPNLDVEEPFSEAQPTEDQAETGAQGDVHTSLGDDSVSPANQLEITNAGDSPNIFQNSRYLPPTPNVKRVSIQDVTNCLSMTPTDYSFFDPQLKLKLMGDIILKVKAQARFSKRKTVGVSRRPKASFLDLDNVNLEPLMKKFAVGKRTRLSDRARKKWDRNETKSFVSMSPYDADDLVGLFTLPSVKTRYEDQPSESLKASKYKSQVSDGNIQPESDCEMPLPSSQSEFSSGSTAKETNCEIGLVAEPTMVKRDIISFAKLAKKIDMKMVKFRFWNVLTSDSPEAQQTPKVGEYHKVPSKIPAPISFCAAYKRLLDVLPSKTRKDISIPIAFVALLHIANERNLFLQNNENLMDFLITNSTE